jgi:hypothetical protein
MSPNLGRDAAAILKESLMYALLPLDMTIFTMKKKLQTQLKETPLNRKTTSTYCLDAIFL